MVGYRFAFLILFTSLSSFTFAKSTPPKETHSCKGISNFQSCEYMPGCFYENSSKSCAGAIKVIPRFLKEFLKDTHNVFSLETVLSQTPDLPELSFHYKSLANFINKNAIKKSWVLSDPTIGIPENRVEFNKFLKKISKYGISLENLDEYPSVFLMNSHETAIEKLSVDSKIPIATLLKSKAQNLETFLESSHAFEKIKLLDLGMEEALALDDLSFLQADLDQIQTLLTKVHLKAQQIFAIKDISLINNSQTIAECTNTHSIPWDWISRLEGSYIVIHDCQKFKEISDILKIPLNKFPTQSVKLNQLKSMDLTRLHKLMKELDLSGDFILRQSFIREDIDAIKTTMNTFRISAEDAMGVAPSWNSVPKEKIEELAASFGVSTKDIRGIDAPIFDSPNFLKNYKILKMPLAIFAKHSEITHPEAMKEILDLWMSETDIRDFSKMPFYSFEQIASSPEKMKDFKHKWESYHDVLNFEQLVNKFNSQNAYQFENQIMFAKILIGKLEPIKKLHFLGEADSFFHSYWGLPLVYAKKLGYEDIASLLSKYKPKILRIQTTDGNNAITQCPIEKDVFNSHRESWYQECHPYEKTDLVYEKKVGQFIQSQISFWQRTEISKIPVLELKDVAGAMDNYKSEGYEPMATYITKKQAAPFPFLDKENNLSKEINAVNFAILLAPKSKFETITYRGQGCNEDWIKIPNRFWSTSASAEFGKTWAGTGGCVLEVHLPKGYPLFFLNIASMASAEQHEFLLPSHALNKEGKLVAVRYNIIKEEKERSFESTDYDAEHDIEFQYHFTAHAYLVKPSSDLMVFEKDDDKSFDAYQKQYVEKVCAPENLKSADHSLEYLKQMCEASK